MKIFSILALAVMAITVSAVPAVAAEINTGQTISLEKNSKNPILFSTTANIKSDVEGDLTAFAQTISVDAPISASAYLFGQTINVNAQIGNRLIAAGADTNIKSQINGDLIIAAGKTTIDSTAKIDGDVYAAGSEITIKGQVGGKLVAVGSKVVLDGALIGGDVAIQSDQISFSDNSQIAGKFKYSSSKEISLPSSQVKGGISFVKVGSQAKSSPYYSAIGAILMIIAFALVMFWLLRNKINLIMHGATTKFGAIWLKGFLFLIIVPIAVMVMIVSYVGIYLFIGLILFYLLALMIGYIYGAMLLGYLLVKWISRGENTKVDWGSIVFGSVLFELIGFIPLLGAVFKFVLTIAGVGMLLEQLKELRSVSK